MQEKMQEVKDEKKKYNKRQYNFQKNILGNSISGKESRQAEGLV